MKETDKEIEREKEKDQEYKKKRDFFLLMPNRREQI